MDEALSAFSTPSRVARGDKWAASKFVVEYQIMYEYSS